MSLRIQGSAQCPADETRCARNQNGAQPATRAALKKNMDALDAIGSLWQTGLMLYVVITTAICGLSHFKFRRVPIHPFC